MKKFIIAVCLGCISVSVTAQKNIDVLHYKFSIELNDKNDSIYGKAEITGNVLKESEVFTFDFVYGDEVRKGMKVEKTFLYSYEKKEWVKSGFVQDSDGFCIIDFDKILKPNTVFKIMVEYKGIPADGLIISKNQFGNRTFFADNWPNRAHNWIPCVDDPLDKASVEFIVTAPSHYQVISNGVQIEETNLPGNKKLTHYKEDVPLPTKVMVIGVADFAVSTVGDVNCVPVYSWVYPENKTEGFYDYALAKDILAWHINYIGPYPYKKLANVQSKTKFGGMENAGAIFYAEYSVSGQRLEEELLSHEIVHQWFGDMATEKSFAHLWLSEGFATYLTHVYIESKYGTDSLNNEMKNDREKVIGFVKTSRRPVVDSTPNYMQLLNANSYQKGSWVLHMLRRQLGDSVFRQSIRQYYATYAGKNADTKDLQRIFETVSGKDLDKFFNQWLHTAENPSLDIKWSYDQKKKQLTININQKQSHEFRFSLEIALTSKTGKTVIEKLLIDRRSKSFTFSSPAKPLAVIADPNTSLLFEGAVSEVK